MHREEFCPVVRGWSQPVKPEEGSLRLWVLLKLQLEGIAAVPVVMCDPRTVYITLLLHKLYWLPVCFHVQFKVLILTIKTLHGIGLGYLRSVCLIGSGRESMLQVQSARELHLAYPSRWSFFAMAPTLWNFLSPEVGLVPFLTTSTCLSRPGYNITPVGPREPERFCNGSFTVVNIILSYFVSLFYICDCFYVLFLKK